MIEIIQSRDKTRLDKTLDRIQRRNVALDSSLMLEVSTIVSDVAKRGDAALVDCSSRFDGFQVTPADLRISESTLVALARNVDCSVRDALREAIRRVRLFHESERPQSWENTNEGVRIGQRITPLDSAGLYVPGGSASYPSSVVMNVVPAQVAGVHRIAIATPPQSLHQNPSVAAALVELGVTEVYALGGAQAIAALAFGTQTVQRVDKITGPGNRYVAAAKRLVFGVVGIDSIAGPTEIVVLADDTGEPSHIASDLLAQAEHSIDASAVLVTTSAALAERVLRELIEQSKHLPRADVTNVSLAEYGTIIVVEKMAEGCAIVNRLAPEHLQIVSRNEEEIAHEIRHAGAIFFGDDTPEAAGDYLAGPNHVLPTSGAARFSSALSVSDFVRRTSILRLSSSALSVAAPMIATLARTEGLEAHARSALIRLKGRSQDD
jgi:histidinol dehydrogenase